MVLLLPLFGSVVIAEDEEVVEEELYIFDGQVIWINDKEAYRPQQLVITMYKNDEYVQEVITNAEVDWTYHFEDVKTEGSNQYKFSLSGVRGYSGAVDGTNFVLTRLPVNVRIQILDLGASPFEGATGYVTDENGQVVGEFAGSVLDLELLPGTYTFHETAVPEGFKLGNEFAFEVNGDGIVDVYDANGNVIQPEGNTLSVVIMPDLRPQPEEPDSSDETGEEIDEEGESEKPERPERPSDAFMPITYDDEPEETDSKPSKKDETPQPAADTAPQPAAPAYYNPYANMYNQPAYAAVAPAENEKSDKANDDTDSKDKADKDKEDKAETTDATEERPTMPEASDVESGNDLAEPEEMVGGELFDDSAVGTPVVVAMLGGMLAILIYGVVVVLQLRKNPFDA